VARVKAIESVGLSGMGGVLRWRAAPLHDKQGDFPNQALCFI
jgi:hypothetical protein